MDYGYYPADDQVRNLQSAGAIAVILRGLGAILMPGSQTMDRLYMGESTADITVRLRLSRL
jgi:hypothetical protein